MDLPDDDRILIDLTSILFDKEMLNIPPGILERIRKADQALKEETSLLKPFKDKLSDLKERNRNFSNQSYPAFALEGKKNSPKEEDPIADLLGSDDRAETDDSR